MSRIVCDCVYVLACVLAPHSSPYVDKVEPLKPAGVIPPPPLTSKAADKPAQGVFISAGVMRAFASEICCCSLSSPRSRHILFMLLIAFAGNFVEKEPHYVVVAPRQRRPRRSAHGSDGDSSGIETSDTDDDLRSHRSMRSGRSLPATATALHRSSGATVTYTLPPVPDVVAGSLTQRVALAHAEAATSELQRVDHVW